jgi:hypothetical protein
MPPVVLPGHNPVQVCDRHPQPRFYFASGGCNGCKASEHAARLSAEPRPTADLIAQESALLERAKQRTLATLESVDRMLREHQAEQRKAAHEQRAHAAIEKSFFECMREPP